MTRIIPTTLILSTLLACQEAAPEPPESCADGYTCMEDCLAPFFAGEGAYAEVLPACLEACRPTDERAADRLGQIAAIAAAWCQSDRGVTDFDSAEGRACLETGWHPSDDPADGEGWPASMVEQCLEAAP